MYKSRGAPFYPFTCARTVGVAPTATLRGGKPERSQRNKMVRGNAKARNTRQQRGEVETPGKALAGAASAAPARTLPGQLAQTPTEQAMLPLEHCVGFPLKRKG